MTFLNVMAVFAATFMAVLPSAAVAQQDYADKANSLIESYARSDLFSGSILVAQHGKPIFRKAFGPANREWDVPNTLDTKFRIGSVTKQFTAAAILQLAEQGKLKLDDPISEYYADAPLSWKKITIRHLLTHTSGIPSYTALPEFFTKLSRADRTPQEIIKLTQDLPLEFEPGTAFTYDNTGYILLGYVIEKVTGHSYSQYLKDNIFDPLGMNSTGYDSAGAIIPRRASGYALHDDRWDNAAYFAMSLPFAAGALYSTVDDLLRWEEALSGGKVISAGSLQAMFTDYGHTYGFGWMISNRFGRRLRMHTGGINGFRSTVDIYPDEDLTIIILSNIENAPVPKIGSELAALQFGVSEGLHVQVPIDPAVLDQYLGDYQLGPKFVLHVTRDGDRLFVQGTKQPKLEVFAESDRLFFYKIGDAKITFEIDPAGRASGLALHQIGTDHLGRRIDKDEAKRIEEQPAKEHKEVAVDPRIFDRLTGRYQFNPKFFLTISRSGDHLFSQATGQPQIEIFPEGEHDYFLKVVDAQITFETDDEGRVLRLILHQGGLDTPAPRVD
jgi:D-alanyl-D-alanine carboxypeptidase